MTTINKERQFSIFKEECEKWIKEFGLTNFSIKIVHEKARVNDDSEAWTWTNPIEDYIAKIGLNPDNKAKTDKEIKEYALHEVLHVLLARIDAVSRYRFVSESEVTESLHEIINRFTNYIFKN